MTSWIVIFVFVLALYVKCEAFGRGTFSFHQSIRRSAYNPNGFRAPPQDVESESVQQVTGAESGGIGGVSYPGQGYPTRADTFQVLVTGHIGTEPKEVYLRNNSYVVNFSVITYERFTFVV